MFRFSLLYFFLSHETGAGYIRDQCCHLQGDGASLIPHFIYQSCFSSVRLLKKVECDWLAAESFSNDEDRFESLCNINLINSFFLFRRWRHLRSNRAFKCCYEVVLKCTLKFTDSLSSHLNLTWLKIRCERKNICFLLSKHYLYCKRQIIKAQQRLTFTWN